jgi:hypothetical protein
MRFIRYLAAFAVIAGNTAHAQEDIYVGLGLGQYEYDEKQPDPILGQVSDTVGIVKLFGGFAFNEHIALEISYAETSDIIDRVTENIAPFGDVTFTLKTDSTLTTLKVLGQLPLDWGVLLGGIGFFSASHDFSEAFTADCCEPILNGGEFSDDGAAAMLGIEWRFGRFGAQYGIRIEYEWWDMNFADTSAVSVGFTYGF